MYVFPIGKAVTMPRGAKDFERAVFGFEPVPKLLLSPIAIAVHALRAAAVVTVFVPEIVSQGRRMCAIPLDQGNQELLGQRPSVFVVHAKTRKPSRSTTAGDIAVNNASIASVKTCAGILREQPLRRRSDELGDDDFHPVLRRQVHHSIVVAPVVFAGRDLDGRPHEPMTKCVHPDLGGGLVVPLPVLLGRIRFAKIDGAIRKDRIRCKDERRDQQDHCREEQESRHGYETKKDLPPITRITLNNLVQFA